ncbi:MAG: hypothetical protein M0Z99_33925 [Betaproteobacteria bacterium]|nr:hypothetical protein [Betaproteobacteria bacterium]
MAAAAQGAVRAVVLTPADQAALEARQLEVLEKMGTTLAATRTKHIEARVGQGIDQRWYEDVEAYEGRDAVTRHYAALRETVQGYVSTGSVQKSQSRSTLVINVTRSKVNANSARLQDVALPTDDRNWDLRPSTVPQLVENLAKKDMGLFKDGKPIMVTDNGTQRQATLADLAKLDMEKAKKCAEAMRDEIDDQLDISAGGCGYEGVVRAVMEDESLLGVGVGKGPTITSRVKKVWLPITDGERTVHVLQRLQEKKPVSARVNPWDIYPHPECGENPTKFPIWERLPGITASDLRGYADIPGGGYIRSQIAKVLREGPRKPEHPVDKPGTDQPVTHDTSFEAWEYHGELTREQLEAAGCDCGPDGEDWTTYSACVIMVNNTVIKADIEILDTNEMPYDFFVTNKCSGSWAGYGTAYLARHAQKAITAAWRAMMDNAGQYIGAQTVLHHKVIQPADGKWEMRGPKLWWYVGTEANADMGKLFGVHEIPARQEQYAAIIKMGMEFLDSETAIPMLAQGEQGTATDVLGGMNLLLNASNVMIRRKLKAFDDQFTIRHIGRYVDWNMQYNPKPEIKGDFEVQARASGALMDTEIQNKTSGLLLNLVKDPEIGYGMKKWEVVRRVVRAGRFDPKDFVFNDAEIKVKEAERAKTMQPDPRIQVEQIRAEAAARIEAARQHFESQQAELDRQNKIAIAMIDEKLQNLDLQSMEAQVLAKIKAELSKTLIQVNAQKELSREDMLLQAHVHHTPKAELLPEPEVEPAGRAQSGQSFAQ